MENLEAMYESLHDYIVDYAADKAELDKLDKRCKKVNATIKELMFDLGISEESYNGYRCVRSVQQRESLDEEKLIKMLKRYAPDTECIKKKEYVDMDVLENEIYHGLLSDDAMIALDECRNMKEVVVLTVKKEKK
jgi:hypothetical protein